jgi:hypothetical protein
MEFNSCFLGKLVVQGDATVTGCEEANGLSEGKAVYLGAGLHPLQLLHEAREKRKLFQ